MAGIPPELPEPAVFLNRLLDFAYIFHGKIDSTAYLQDLLTELQDMWIFPREDVRGEAYRLLGLSPEMEPDEVAVRHAYHRALFQAFRVYMLFIGNDLLNESVPEAPQYRRTFSSVLETITYSHEYVASEHRLRIITNRNVNAVSESLVPMEIQLFKFSFPDFSENNEFQNLLIFLLRELYKRGLRKYRDCCYEQIRTAEGYLTHAWQEKYTIKKFICAAINKETNFAQWKNLMKAKDNASAAAKTLNDFDDAEFPELQPQRNIFSMHQGIYNTRICAFFPFATTDLNQSVIAINYFDLDIPLEIFDNDDWYSIPTPAMQSILAHQKIPEDAIRWIYALMGRCLFELKDLDTWEVILFIKGVAGTGKSTIGRVVSSFFQAADVAVLSANIEEKFGLQNIYDKLLYVCYEVRNKFGLTQAEFQCMVSGEKMSIARKNLGTAQLEWKAPGLLLGNEVPSWVDVAGSVNRRTVLVEFKEKVLAPDTTLYQRLYKELPSLLHKCNVAYQEAVYRYGKSGIWSHLPQYFHDTQRNLAANFNSLTSFIMRSDRIELNPNKYIPTHIFTDEYNSYVKSNRLPGIRLVGDYVDTIYQNFDIVSEMSVEREWLGQMVRQNYLTGVGLRNDGDGHGAAASSHFDKELVNPHGGDD